MTSDASQSSSTSPSSSTSQSSAPEEAGTSAPESTYRYSRFYRISAFAQSGVAGLLAIMALWEVFSGSGLLNWLWAAGLLLLALQGGYEPVRTLLSVFYLTEDRLRKERPFHADKDIPLGEVRRMFIGGRSVKIFVSPGTQPDLEFGRWLEGSEELIGKLARRLPAGAEIECPSGELASRLAGRT
jgi:hypothetical protein